MVSVIILVHSSLMCRIHLGPWNSVHLARLESSANGLTSLAVTMTFLLYGGISLVAIAYRLDQVEMSFIQPAVLYLEEFIVCLQDYTKPEIQATKRLRFVWIPFITLYAIISGSFIFWNGEARR